MIINKFAAEAGLGRVRRAVLHHVGLAVLKHREAMNYGLAMREIKRVERRYGAAGLFYLVVQFAVFGAPKEAFSGVEREWSTQLMLFNADDGTGEEVTIDDVPPHARAFVRLTLCVLAQDASTALDIWRTVPAKDQRIIVQQMADKAVEAFNTGKMKGAA